MTTSAQELSRVVKHDLLPKFTESLKQFFLGRKLKMLTNDRSN